MLSFLSLGSLYKIADWLIFPLLFYVFRYRRKVVRRNISIAFPEYTTEQVKQLENRSYRQLCSVIAEAVYGWRAGREKIEERVIFDSTLKDIMSEFDEHQMAIVQLSHIGCWEWFSNVAFRFREIGVKMLVVYRPPRNRQTDSFLCELREKRGCEVVRERQVLRRLYSARQNGEKVLLAMLSDQRPAPKTGRVMVNFFGKQVAFINGSEVLAKKFGCSVYSLSIKQLERGRYAVSVPKLADANETGDAVVQRYATVVQRYATVVEENIRLQPHLWLWTHNRFRDNS